jgi:hypothetical protein
LHDDLHGKKSGLIDRVKEAEEVIADVNALRVWATRLGITALGAIAMSYFEQIKTLLKIGPTP